MTEIETTFTHRLDEFTSRLQDFKQCGVRLWRDLAGWLGALSLDRRAQVKRRWQGLLPAQRVEILAMNGRGEVPDYLALEADIVVHPSTLKALAPEAKKKIADPEYNVEILNPHGAPSIKRLGDLNKVEWNQVIDEKGKLLERAEEQAKRILRPPAKPPSESIPLARNYQRIDGALIKIEAWPNDDQQDRTVIVARIADLRKWVS
jgi:hypothetical protein